MNEPSIFEPLKFYCMYFFFLKTAGRIVNSVDTKKTAQSSLLWINTVCLNVFVSNMAV